MRTEKHILNCLSEFSAKLTPTNPHISINETL